MPKWLICIKDHLAKPKFIHMKKVLLLLGIILVACGVWYFAVKGNKKPAHVKESVPLAVSRHSDSFNLAIKSILTAYYDLSESMVNWDTAVVTKNIAALQVALNGFNVEDLKKDTTGIYESALDPYVNMRNEVAGMATLPTLDARRSSFNNMSDNLRTLLLVTQYDRAKVYWQECPMAFGDNKPGNWLSATEDIRNPYLGTKHPQYKDEMLHCGGTKDTINFTVPIGK